MKAQAAPIAESHPERLGKMSQKTLSARGAA